MPRDLCVLSQCRHINYESLEAFLCVECGYCAYAHFGFRILAAMETDIAPVTNEASPEEAMKGHDLRPPASSCCRGVIFPGLFAWRCL